MPDLIAKSCGLAIGVGEGEGVCGKRFRYLVERNDCPARIVAELQRGIKSVCRHFKAPFPRYSKIPAKTSNVLIQINNVRYRT
jgi:hypothetical protein